MVRNQRTRTFGVVLQCSNPNCATYDLSGAAPIVCPSCDQIIGASVDTSAAVLDVVVLARNKTLGVKIVNAVANERFGPSAYQTINRHDLKLLTSPPTHFFKLVGNGRGPAAQLREVELVEGLTAQSGYYYYSAQVVQKMCHESSFL